MISGNILFKVPYCYF